MIMMRKTGLAGMPLYDGKKEIYSTASPGKPCRSSSSPSAGNVPVQREEISGCENSAVPEIRPSDEISMMKDMIALAGIEGRDATELILHFNKASKELKSGNSRGFESEAELFYMEFDRIYHDETECIFHSY